MSTLQVPLTESLRAFVETEAAARGFGTPGEYVKDMLGEVQKRKAWNDLEKLALEGIASGLGSPITDEYWQDLLEKIDRGFSNAPAS